MISEIWQCRLPIGFMVSLLGGCEAPTEVKEAPKSPREKVCLVGESTPKGCCLVGGKSECGDPEPPGMK